MSDLTPETLAELRRLYEVAFSVAAPENDWEEWTSKAAEAFPALLDAAAERDRLARLLDEPRRSGCAVEIAGVRIVPCDERGQTADMLAADRLRRELAERFAHASMIDRAAIDELRRLAEAATPGPWEAYHPHPHYRQYAVDAVTPEGHLGYAVATTQDVQAEANAELIVAAVNALPALLDAAELRWILDAETEGESCGSVSAWLLDIYRDGAAVGWDACMKALQYEDGTPVEIVSFNNPYRTGEE